MLNKKVILTVFLVLGVAFIVYRLNYKEEFPHPLCLSDICVYEKSNGELAFEKYFDGANGFSKNGLARVKTNQKFNDDTTREFIPSKNGYINLKGEMVIPQIYDWASDFLDNDLAIVTNFPPQSGLINSKGETLIPMIYNDMFSVGNDLFAVQIKNKWGFIDKNGKIVIPVKFQNVYNSLFTEFGVNAFKASNLASVQIKKKWGFIDKKGKLIITAIFDEAHNFTNNGLALVKIKGKYGFINEIGNIVIPAIFDMAYDFSESGLAVINIKNKDGFIDKTGKIVIPTTFDEAHGFTSNGLSAVKIKDKYGFIDKTGKIVIPTTFDMANSFDKYGLAVVEKNGIEFSIKENGEKYISEATKYLEKLHQEKQ